jgi:hypothetical protein
MTSMYERWKTPPTFTPIPPDATPEERLHLRFDPIQPPAGTLERVEWDRLALTEPRFTAEQRLLFRYGHTPPPIGTPDRERWDALDMDSFCHTVEWLIPFSIGDFFPGPDDDQEGDQ